MSSKSKEGTKAQTSDYVDALSEAIMRIFNYSNNDIFVSKCFSYLQVNTPSHARKEIQKYFQKVIGFADSSKEPESYLQRSLSHSKTFNLNQYESFDDPEIQSACASNTISYPFDDTFEDPSFNSFHPYPEQHIPGFQAHRHVGQFSSDSFVDLANESISSMCLTSTPYESDIACPAFETNLPLTLVEDVDSEDELEILRCVNHENDEYYNDEVEDVNEEIESSYGSLNFSIPNITEPTASEYSVNFSHPEYLNESYLLRDLTDLLGQSDEAVEINVPHIDPDMTELSNEGISSQELIDKALSSINESLLADVQDNFQPAIMIAPESPEIFQDYIEDIRDITPESHEIFEDYTEAIRDISSVPLLHKNYILDERQKNNESKSVQNVGADELDCVIVYDTSKNQIVTEATTINNSNINNTNNSHNPMCSDDDIILTCEYSYDTIETEKSAENNKLDSQNERLSTEEKLLPSSGDPLEKSLENFLDDDDDMETQYECYFDSNNAAAFKNNDEKSTEEEDTDDNDEESMPSHKDELIVIKTNSNIDQDGVRTDNNYSVNNNNSHNLECSDVIILTCECSNDNIGTEKSAEINKLGSKTERFSTKENLLPNSGDPLEKCPENIYDDDGMETRYECYFDSISAVALENIDDKLTEEEDTDDNDDESMPSHKDKLIVIKSNSNIDYDNAIADNKCTCRAVGEVKTWANSEVISIADYASE